MLPDEDSKDVAFHNKHMEKVKKKEAVSLPIIRVRKIHESFFCAYSEKSPHGCYGNSLHEALGNIVVKDRLIPFEWIEG